MKIIKRSGSEVTFDLQKIIHAIKAANTEVKAADRLTERQVVYAAQNVEDKCSAAGHTVSVEEIQDMVEDELMALDRYEVARRYIIYRYVQGLKRTKNTTDDKILSLIECNNEEVKQENSNKNPTVNSVQRDYMAGEVSKDLTQRVLLPAEVVKAHNEGIIHFHDSDYFAQHMHNCDLVNLDDMLQNGTVISGTLIERPHSFSTACNIATQIIAQVASCQYGGQSISLTHLAPFVDVSRQKIRRQVEAELAELGFTAPEEKVAEVVETRLRDEIRRGVQTIQYQVVTRSLPCRRGLGFRCWRRWSGAARGNTPRCWRMPAAPAMSGCGLTGTSMTCRSISRWRRTRSTTSRSWWTGSSSGPTLASG